MDISFESGDNSQSGTRAQDAPPPNAVFVSPLTAQERRALNTRIQRLAPGWPRRRHLREGRQGGPLCNICYEERAASDVYTCDGRHTSCSACLTSFILLNWRSHGARGVGGGGGARVNELRCCHPSCTSKPIPPATVLQLVTQKDALAVYVEQLQRMSAAQAFGEAQAIVVAEAPQAAAESLLLKQLQLSMSHARMCPRCKHGPVDFAGCDDLAQHHMEGHAHGGRTSNACRQCGFFAQSVREWEYWDGVIRNEPQRETPVPQLSRARDTHSIPRRPARAVLHFVADRSPRQVFVRPEHTPPVVTDRPLMQFYARPEHTPPSQRHHDSAELTISTAVAMVADILPYADVQLIHQACSDAVASQEHLRSDPAALAMAAMDSLLG